MTRHYLSVDRDKADRVRRKAQGMDVQLTHAQAQELLASAYGDENWAALRARRKAEFEARQATTDAAGPAPKRDITSDLLALCATALRDLHMGYHPREVAASSGQGLETLLVDVVTHLRGQGIDDEGGWDTKETRCIAVARPAGQVRHDGAWLRDFARFLYAQGFSDEDLDELVHDFVGGLKASSINNHGLAAQLEALLESSPQPQDSRAELRELVADAAAQAELPDEAQERIRNFSLT